MGNSPDGKRQTARKDAPWYNRKSEGQKIPIGLQDLCRWANKVVGVDGICQRES
jgi:hypothetical protein